MKADCVIVGGGIGGAVLALALGRRGRQVVILEKGAPLSAFARPEVLAEATLRAFDRLGAGERIRAEAVVPLQGLRLYRSGGRMLLWLAQEDLQRSGAQPYSTDPARTRRILLEAAEATGCVALHQGVEVQALSPDEAGAMRVRARREGREESWTAPLVVGDDGGQSRVRQSIGIPLRVQELPIEFLGAAGSALPSQPAREAQAWIRFGALQKGVFGGVFMPLPEGRSALALLLSHGALAAFRAGEPERFYESAEHLSPLCRGLSQIHRFPDGFGSFRRPFGHAPRYVSDAVALLGDAAHPVTPAGGQGANMSVADAMVLAEVAGEALREGECSAKRLMAYEARRRAANERSLQFSALANRNLRFIASLPWLAEPALRYRLERVNRSMEAKARLLKAVSLAFMQA